MVVGFPRETLFSVQMGESKIHLRRVDFKKRLFGWPNKKRSSQPQLRKNYETEKWLGGGFKHFLFSALFGEDSHFD